MELGVKKARALRNGKEVELNIEEVVVGEYLIVKAGEIRGIKCLENLVLLSVTDLDPIH